MSEVTVQGQSIKTKAALVQATDEAFSEIRTMRPDSPPEALAVLDAGLAALRAIRDNPLVEDGNPRILSAMAELTYAITAAAGINRAIVVSATKVPAGVKLN
jgi:hypothetical protein